MEVFLTNLAKWRKIFAGCNYRNHYPTRINVSDAISEAKSRLDETGANFRSPNMSARNCSCSFAAKIISPTIEAITSIRFYYANEHANVSGILDYRIISEGNVIKKLDAARRGALETIAKLLARVVVHSFLVHTEDYEWK
ncbi:hypothetical protein Trydic_g13763 [Trypoxylus dichotomus]